jgi:hypothetical protein
MVRLQHIAQSAPECGECVVVEQRGMVPPCDVAVGADEEGPALLDFTTGRPGVVRIRSTLRRSRRNPRKGSVKRPCPVMSRVEIRLPCSSTSQECGNFAHGRVMACR